MSVSKRLSSACWGIALFAMCACVSAAAPLLNLDNPNRIPGQYYVSFKSKAELNAVPSKGVGAPQVLPDVRPISREAVEKLAKAFAQRANAEVGELIVSRRRSGFVIKGISEDKLRQLADDPRLDFIEALLPVTLNSK